MAVYYVFLLVFVHPSIGWLVDLGLTELSDNISVYIGSSLTEREKEERNDRRGKKCPNNPHAHLLQAQSALALL